MAHKSQIRVEIEKILRRDYGCCYIDSRKKGIYRMKLVSLGNMITKKQQGEIEKLPHVIKVGFTFSTSYRSQGGITIHFDCKLSQITL